MPTCKPARVSAPRHGRTRSARARLASLLLLVLLAIPAVVHADDPATLRVGTSGDYAPFSLADEDGALAGFDIELARRYAKDRGLAIEFVRFRWRKLLDGLASDRFDVAMSGITVRPERSAAGVFTVPVLETGAVALVRQHTRTEVAQLDRQGLRIAVNAGGHLERVARARFPRATVIAIPDNASVLAALRDENVDAVVTDSVEARLWLVEEPELIPLGPFTRDRKALLVNARRPELATDLDQWLLDREADGGLAALRKEYLGEGPWRPLAEPLTALLAAVDERLSLMPLVAVVKRETGVPLEVPEREGLVIEAAATTMLEAAKERDVVPPSYLTIQQFFRAQLEAAKQVQRDAVKNPPERDDGELPDLDETLRPALLRIGARIARLLVRLPAGTELETVRASAKEELREPLLAESYRRGIIEAIPALAD